MSRAHRLAMGIGLCGVVACHDAEPGIDAASTLDAATSADAASPFDAGALTGCKLVERFQNDTCARSSSCSGAGGSPAPRSACIATSRFALGTLAIRPQRLVLVDDAGRAQTVASPFLPEAADIRTNASGDVELTHTRCEGYGDAVCYGTGPTDVCLVDVDGRFRCPHAFAFAKPAWMPAHFEVETPNASGTQWVEWAAWDSGATTIAKGAGGTFAITLLVPIHVTDGDVSSLEVQSAPFHGTLGADDIVRFDGASDVAADRADCAALPKTPATLWARALCARLGGESIASVATRWSSECIALGGTAPSFTFDAKHPYCRSHAQGGWSGEHGIPAFVVRFLGAVHPWPKP